MLIIFPVVVSSEDVVDAVVSIVVEVFGMIVVLLESDIIVPSVFEESVDVAVIVYCYCK